MKLINYLKNFYIEFKKLKNMRKKQINHLNFF